MLRQLLGVFLQLGEVVERVGVLQLRGVDQAHEQIAHFGTVGGLIEQAVLAIAASSLSQSSSPKIIAILEWKPDAGPGLMDSVPVFPKLFPLQLARVLRWRSD